MLCLKKNSSSIVENRSHSEVPVEALHPENDRHMSGGLQKSAARSLRSSAEISDDFTGGATIQQRLARLKKSGESDWQKRKSRLSNVKDELLITSTGKNLVKGNCSVSPPGAPSPEENKASKCSTLADRLSKLDAALSGWKKRLQPSDAIRFSVEGKMGIQNWGALPAQMNREARKKRCPKYAKFKSKKLSWPLEEDGDRAGGPIRRKDVEEKVEGTPSVVSIPRNDNESFTLFFRETRLEPTVQQQSFHIEDEDLDVATQMKSSPLLIQKRSIKKPKRRATLRNPLKSLASRLDAQEYVVVKTRALAKPSETSEKSSNLAREALAGLASQEDFTAISLKKASESGVASPDVPYKDLMLLHVKGRRHVQTRLVEPVAASLNAGDCFILVTKSKVFQYVGKFANVIEKSRAAEISCHIQQKGDLGCASDSVITIGETGGATQEEIDDFWKLLGGKAGCEREAGHPEEDEIYEASITDTNMVYEMVGNELIPDECFWGAAPKIEILDPNKVLVFDFGSEFYVWNGKAVDLAKRKFAVDLGKELWEEGFNYSDCAFCPITAASLAGAFDFATLNVPDSAKVGASRPSWTLFAKVTQNMETILFREKFIDWPDNSWEGKKSQREEDEVRGGGGEAGENDEVSGIRCTNLTACDAADMIRNVLPEPDLVLEGTHLGRGIAYFDEESRRRFEVSTRGVTVWHVNGYEHSEMPAESIGQFHEGDSYVVRWHYTVTVTCRELSGRPSRRSVAGRDRFAYFCWQGRCSPVNDKGAAARLTVELDKESGPQVRVTQGSEMPAFLNLFRGRTVVHLGRRTSSPVSDGWRLFVCRGEAVSEAILFEVPCSKKHLRSATSFVLLNGAEGKLMAWHGSRATEHRKKIVMAAVREIQNRRPKEFNFLVPEISVSEEIEGNESTDFEDVFRGEHREPHFRVIEEESSSTATPRLFYLSSVSGRFESSEIDSPYRRKDIANPLPFLQSDLYSASQPALFLLDTGTVLWLWQGWRLDDTDGDRGGGCQRFQAERKAAISTAISYWECKNGKASAPEIYSVWAGLEPSSFTNHFPYWTNRDDVAEINIKDGKKPGEMVRVQVETTAATGNSFYSLAQLRSRPLPDGVNPNFLEDYLNPECFQELFGLEREEFFKMPSWKKKKLKQEAGLF